MNNAHTPHESGQLYVVSAPSGAGKTSLVSALLKDMDHIGVSVSHTTRAMRPGEENGVNYHFVDEPAFQAMIERGEFFEHAWVFDRHYGTSRPAVSARLAAGEDVILEIDWQGARQIREQRPATRSIFILPPSFNALRTRLSGRGQDDEATIARRMKDAVSEMSHFNEYDYVVINDDFEVALAELRSIIQGERCRSERVQLRQSALLEDLLSHMPPVE